MKAIVCTKYGHPEVLQLKEVEKPIPKNNELLVRIRATTVTAGDVRIRRFDVPKLFWFQFRLILGIKRPRRSILGVEYAGEVELVGAEIKNFKKGDRVFGSTSWLKFGCYAEYTVQKEDGIISKIPDNLGFEEVASVPFMGIGALHFIKKATIRKGQKMLIYGASGAVGTYAVQLSKHFGAEVTAVCSTSNLELVKSIGAQRVIDYTQEDISTNREQFDIFLDAVGKCPFSKAIKTIKKDGIYITVDRDFTQTIQGLWTKMTSKKKVIAGTASAKIEDLEFLNELLASGKLKSVIDKGYPFEKMAEAHRYVDLGHKKGNVVVTID